MTANPNAKVQKFISKQYIDVLGKNLPAIYEATNRGIETLETTIQACIDQLFLTTASGSFLVKLGEEQGFVMPANSGLDIRSYRVLVPIMVASPKQVRFTIDELIQAFYLKERTKPNIESTIAGPYSLNNGDDLIVETESDRVSVSIVSAQVSDLTSVSAQEVAAVLNISQDIFLAEAITDRATGLASVRLISNTFGAGSFIRIAGGKLQNVLQFPNLVEDNSNAATTWTLTKESTYTNILKIQWNGVGTNPDIYKAKQGDVVTIRGLVDGVEAFSLLNGSYDLIDVGYDYFVIKNDLFDVTSATLIQGYDNAFLFTKSDKITIFDAPEYALTSETSQQTITLTVPAIPPLTRRFLQGSAHLHGHVHDVIDFTRSTITVEVLGGQDLPVADNFFVIRSRRQRVDFTVKYFKTEVVDSNTSQPTYTINTADAEYSTLPYTTPTPVGTVDVIYAELDSSEYRVDFPDFRHGLRRTWGFTLAGFTGAANILAADLNKEQSVRKVINSNSVTFTINDSLGNPKPFTGISFAAADVYRHALPQSDGSDFYIDFGSASAAIASGLVANTTFRFDAALGTDVDPFYSGLLRYGKFYVTSVNGALVNFTAGYGIGPEGSIMTSVPGVRSGYIGGTSGTYFLDKTSTINQERVFADLQTIFIGYTVPSNPEFLGSYVYDPDGIETSLTVSRYLVHSTDAIFKGESKNAIFVDDSALGDDTFPQSGEIVIDYGTSTVEGPVRYSAFVKNTGGVTQILIDPAYEFKKTHSAGAQIQYIHAKTAYVPSLDGTDYPFYITGTSAARNTLFLLTELLIASGIFVETDVILPEMRYEDTSIAPFE